MLRIVGGCLLQTNYETSIQVEYLKSDQTFGGNEGLVSYLL